MEMISEKIYPISMRSKNASNFSCGVGNLSAKSTAQNMRRAKLLNGDNGTNSITNNAINIKTQDQKQR
jgi:hypothetical protein